MVNKGLGLFPPTGRAAYPGRNRRWFVSQASPDLATHNEAGVDPIVEPPHA
jgi:hypothetical protein